MALVDVHDLHKRYKPDAPEAVAGIDFSVSEGEIFGLLGPNGAGKSTLMRTVATLQEPTAGTIKFGDRPMRQHAALMQNDHCLADALDIAEQMRRE